MRTKGKRRSPRFFPSFPFFLSFFSLSLPFPLDLPSVFSSPQIVFDRDVILSSFFSLRGEEEEGDGKV